MIFEYISLKNYRQYKEAKLEFALPNKGKNFTILQAPNGVGKSNLFNAINWCLYGKELFITKEEKRLPLVNTISLKENRKSEKCEVEIELKMRDEENKLMLITRKQMFYIDREGNITRDSSNLTIVREINHNMVNITSEQQEFINRNIPENIKEYFFFDGERLDDYFKKEGAESIKKAVYRISHIEILDRVINHLDYKHKEILRQNKDLTPAAESIRLEIQAAEEGVVAIKKDLDEKKTSLSEARLNIREIQEKRKKNPVPNTKELKEKREELDKSLEEYEKKIEEHKSEFSNYFKEIAPKILLHESFINVKKIIEDKKKKKEMPPGITKEYIDHLLKSGECICGREICSKDKSKDKISDLLNIYANLSDIGNYLVEMQGDTESILRQVKEFEKRYKDYEKRLKDLQMEFSTKSQELKKIKDKLSGTDESFAILEEQQQDLETARDDMLLSIGKLEGNIKSGEDFIKIRNKDLNDELSKEKRFAVLKSKLDFYSKALEKATNIKEAIMKETKMEIEDKTKKQFFNLIWNPTSFRDIKIDDDYNLSVIHKSGLESIGSLSAGQRQVLALSFIAALNSVSGFKLPIIIDTPLGRISKETRLNIASKLPEFLEDKQVTLLVTDEEYTDEVRKKLGKNVGKEYEISLKEHDDGAIATIKEKK